MMEWFLEIEEEKDFEDQVMEFRACTMNNSFNNFITFFSERDVEVRRLNKMVQGCAKVAEYHSSANVNSTNKYISDKVNAKLANVAAAVEAAVDDRTFNSGATASLMGSNETTVNVANKLTSSTQDAILATLNTISDRLDKVEKQALRALRQAP